MTELGARLKEARLAKGYSLDDLQEITKIQKRYLIGIEEGNYSIMPGSFYVRAFIKQYAEAVGLDAEQILTEYRSDIPAVQKEEVAQSYTHSPSRRKMTSSSNSKMMEAMPKLIVALFAIVILVVITTLYMQKANNVSDIGGEDINKPIEYEKSPSSSQNKPPTAEVDGKDPEEDVQPEEPVQQEPAVVQVIGPGVANGENTTYEVTGTDTLAIRVEVSGLTWVGIRNEQRQEQVEAKSYNARDVVEHDSTENGYARIRLGNAKAAKVFVNGEEVQYVQDRTTQNIILKLVKEEQQGE